METFNALPIIGNPKIARFMGWELSESGRKLSVADFYPHGYLKAHPDCLYFHFSWDWLMPVVRKIVGLCCAEGNEELFMSDQYSSILDTVPLADIESSFKVVVEFVDYWNTFTDAQKETYLNNWF